MDLSLAPINLFIRILDSLVTSFPGFLLEETQPTSYQCQELAWENFERNTARSLGEPGLLDTAIRVRVFFKFSGFITL